MLAIIALFGMCMIKQGGHMKEISKQYKKDVPEEYMGFENDQKSDRFLEFFSVSSAACAHSDADSCDADDACTWCKSAAVASSCKDINDAKALPASIFSCDKISAIDFLKAPQAACSYSDADSCDADDACTWCKSAAVASSCKDINDAKALPASIFSCDKISAIQFLLTPDATCSHSDADSCDADDACTWCKSAAVASSCKDINDAKALPASIFSCDKLSSDLLPWMVNYKNDQCSITSQDECDSQDACTWCKSAAVASRCYDVADAQALPSSIFDCDKVKDEEDMMQQAPPSPHFKKYHHHKHGHGQSKAHRAIGPLVLIIAVAAHFYYMRAFVKAMKDKETLKGETHDADWGCHWKKNNKRGKKQNKDV